MTDLAAAQAPAPALAPAPTRRGLKVAAWTLLALGVAAVAVALSGAAPEPAPAGLPDAGPLPGWSLPLVRLVGHAAVVALVAALLTGLLGSRRTPAGVVLPAALLWSATSVATFLLGLAEVAGRPVHRVFESELLRFYLTEVPQGRAALLSAGMALAVALVPARRPAGQLGRLALVLAALAPPLLVGHAASAGSHRTAQAALVLHVAASVLWVGGVAALALLADPAAVARRFSPLALGCAALVGVSGLFGAFLRLDALADLFATSYGALLLLKTLAFAGLVAVGATHRRRTLPALVDSPGALRRLVGVEVLVMAGVLGLAAALSRTPLG